MDTLVNQLGAIVDSENVLSEPDELIVYECDGLPQHKHAPRAVVFPQTTEQVSQLLRVLAREGVSFAPRGAGTGLSGGALAIDRGVVIELARMRRILNIDVENRLAVVQTGLVNAHLSRALLPHGLYYVPDPSSQPACTIGGNIAENAGGIHCLKYGTTTDHVLGARVVLSDGAVVDLGGGGVEKAGYDLLGVFVGSEGTFGIATEATLRLSAIPPAVRTLLADFTDVNAASRAVSAIIAAGLIPAALEMLDGAIIRAVEASVFAAGLPQDADAALLIELDGIEAGLDEEAEQVEAICQAHGARTVSRAEDDIQRKKLWAARKGAFGAVGRLSPDVMIQDAVVPRSRLPEVLAETYRISARYDLLLANVFHAGDGNLHPLICFDARRGDDLERVRQAGREIMEACVRAGGSITGEHGVGLDKSSYLPLIFSPDDMAVMLQVRAAFDPSNLCNPGKIIPAPRGCGEARAVVTNRMPAATESVTPEPDTAIPNGSMEPLIQPDAASQLSENSTLPHAQRVFAPTANRGAELRARLSPRARTNQFETRARQATKLKDDRVSGAVAGIVGANNIERLSQDHRTSTSARTLFSEQTIVAAPASEEEAAELLKFAARDSFTVMPMGAGTWLEVGNVIQRADIIVSTRRLTRILSHEPADLVASAEAGAGLDTCQKQFALAGQWLPLDPPDDGRASLGGVVATGLGGVQGFALGRPRNFVIGMRVVLADGRIIKAGGNVVKNVAGYDLCKLFTGSYGTLGLITALTFKLRPVPAAMRTIVASGPLSSLLAAARNLCTGHGRPQAIEILSPRLARQLDTKQVKTDHTLLIKFAGSSPAVIYQTAHALATLRRAGVASATMAGDEEALWQSLAALPLRFTGLLISRASVLPAQLPKFLEEVLQVDEASHPELMWHAGAADGRVRVFAKAPLYYREAVRAMERLRACAKTLGGTLIVESASTEIKSEFDSWGDGGTSSALMQRVKEQLDPDGRLSPGRFFSGSN
ncbi:MAG: glycolate oxidase [Blastocatellia bacterium]|nr:glycolate oxidase [Blastocatellia bacterium]